MGAAVRAAGWGTEPAFRDRKGWLAATREGPRPPNGKEVATNPSPDEERFLRYQIRAIRRFQRLRQPGTPQEAEGLALEWIRRFAEEARTRWTGRVARRAITGLH